MQRRRFTALASILAAPALATLHGTAAAQAPQRVGVLMLHGKNPGTNNGIGLGSLKAALEREGMLVLYPEMPWSRGRYLDGNWDQAMAEMATHTKTLRSQGAGQIVVLAQSLGVPAAMSFAARGGDAQALVLLSPGHVPAQYYASRQNTSVRESIDQARALVAAGKGDTKERFSDINQGKPLLVVTTARDYLSYFDPAQDAEMSVTAPRVPASTPVLTVLGTGDSFHSRARSYFADKLPANPKSQYLEVNGDHISTPAAASDAVVQWIKTVTAPSRP